MVTQPKDEQLKINAQTQAAGLQLLEEHRRCWALTSLGTADTGTEAGREAHGTRAGRRTLTAGARRELWGKR
jgi:hypothetical protein